jgi:hypothetical protein
MVNTTLRTIAVICSVAMCSSQHVPPQGELEEILHQADKRRQEYVGTFRNFTAIESRVYGTLG